MFKEFYPTSNCPICSRELNRYHMYDYWIASCKNKCFKLHYDHEVVDKSSYKGRFEIKECRVWIFQEEEIIFPNRHSDIWPFQYEYYLQQIEYWKENGKYLMKLLES